MLRFAWRHPASVAPRARCRQQDSFSVIPCAGRTAQSTCPAVTPLPLNKVFCFLLNRATSLSEEEKPMKATYPVATCQYQSSAEHSSWGSANSSRGERRSLWLVSSVSLFFQMADVGVFSLRGVGLCSFLLCKLAGGAITHQLRWFGTSDAYASGWLGKGWPQCPSPLTTTFPFCLSLLFLPTHPSASCITHSQHLLLLFPITFRPRFHKACDLVRLGGYCVWFNWC